MSAEEAAAAVSHADEEILDYEADDAPEDEAPGADTQIVDAPPETAGADDLVAGEDAAPATNGDATADQAGAVAASGETDKAASGANTATPMLATGGEDPLEEPPHGSEVFVGGIPKTATVTDEQLLAFAQQGGEVFSCAVLKDPGSGLNRGYGFIKYKSKEVATAAMAKLNNTELPDLPGHQIRVLPSQSKNRLYLGNLPKTMSKEELEGHLKAATKGLESVELLMSKEIPDQNRGFCFLEFYNHACAQHAKSALSPPNFQIGNKPLTITFAEPRRADIAADQANEIKSIFVGGLPDTATEAKLRELFAPLGEITRCFIPAPRDGKTRREFGFVHFTDRASVLQAIENNDKGEKVFMDGAPLDVKMGRVYHENPPPKFQQGGLGQGGFGGVGAFGQGGFGRGGAGRFGGYQQQMGGRFGGRGRFGAGDFSGGYGAQQGTGFGGTYGGGMDDGYGSYGGGGEEYGYGDDSSGYGGYGGMAMGGMGMGGGAAAGGSGMSMVPMMLPNGQVGYVLSGASGVAGAGIGGMGAASMGMGGPMRGRGVAGGVAAQAGGYGAMRGRGGGGGAGYGSGGGYGQYGAAGGRGAGYGSGQQRYAPY